MELLIAHTEQRAAYFRNIMDKAVFGSPEYRQAQMIFAWLCKKAREQYDPHSSENIDADERGIQFPYY